MYGNVVDEVYTNWNAELVSSQNTYVHTEKFEANGAHYNEHVTCL